MKVFVYRPHDEPRDCAAVAYSEEGETLGAHISSSLAWALRDMQGHIPEGAEVVWCVGREQLQKQIDAGSLRGLVFLEEGRDRRSSSAPPRACERNAELLGENGEGRA